MWLASSAGSLFSSVAFPVECEKLVKETAFVRQAPYRLLHGPQHVLAGRHNLVQCF